MVNFTFYEVSKTGACKKESRNGSSLNNTAKSAIVKGDDKSMKNMCGFIF
jgi:hypothetical protein